MSFREAFGIVLLIFGSWALGYAFGGDPWGIGCMGGASLLVAAHLLLHKE